MIIVNIFYLIIYIYIYITATKPATKAAKTQSSQKVLAIYFNDLSLLWEIGNLRPHPHYIDEV